MNIRVRPEAGHVNTSLVCSDLRWLVYCSELSTIRCQENFVSDNSQALPYLKTSAKQAVLLPVTSNRLSEGLNPKRNNSSVWAVRFCMLLTLSEVPLNRPTSSQALWALSKRCDRRCGNEPMIAEGYCASIGPGHILSLSVSVVAG